MLVLVSSSYFGSLRQLHTNPHTNAPQRLDASSMFERPAEQSNNEDTEGETQGTEWPTHDWQNLGWPWDPRNQSIGVQIGRNKWPYGLQKVCTCHIRSHRNSQTVSIIVRWEQPRPSAETIDKIYPEPQMKKDIDADNTQAHTHTHRVLTTEPKEVW